MVNGPPRAGSHYNLGTSRGPDKIGSRAGPGPRAVSCTWLPYSIAGCTIILCIFPSTCGGTLLSHWTPDIFLQLFHPHCVLLVVSVLVPPSLCRVLPIYLKSVTCGSWFHLGTWTQHLVINISKFQFKVIFFLHFTHIFFCSVAPLRTPLGRLQRPSDRSWSARHLRWLRHSHIQNITLISDHSLAVLHLPCRHLAINLL